MVKPESGGCLLFLHDPEDILELVLFVQWIPSEQVLLVQWIPWSRLQVHGPEFQFLAGGGQVV